MRSIHMQPASVSISWYDWFQNISSYNQTFFLFLFARMQPNLLCTFLREINTTKKMHTKSPHKTFPFFSVALIGH